MQWSSFAHTHKHISEAQWLYTRHRRGYLRGPLAVAKTDQYSVGVGAAKWVIVWVYMHALYSSAKCDSVDEARGV